MKVAILGTRGVPARYGGFETCAEELGKRLAARGHAVTVWNRKGFYPGRPGAHLGMTLRYAPALRLRALETLSHTLFSAFKALPAGADAWIVFNSANAPVLALARPRKARVVINVDGLEWKRGKWSALGKAYYRAAERMAARLPVEIVTDSRAIGEYFKEHYGRETCYIPYGAELSQSRDPSLISRFGLRPGGYFLQVTRFEPENNPLLTVRAFEGLDTAKKLVLVGGSKYKGRYQKEIEAAAALDPRVVFPGFIYDKDILRELLTNAFAYVHGNEVGGTNPALLEAMAAGRYIIARDVPYNVEVLGGAGVYFCKDEGDLREKMAWALANPEKLPGFGESARAIITKRYDWDKITDAYERMLRGER
jgi:glycosyltransferase involved in cell wall biosynthesis